MRFVSRRWSDLMEGDCVKLIPDDAEDTWHLYNLVQVGDFFGGTTTRKVKADTGSDELPSKSNSSSRVVLNLIVVVSSTAYDAHTGVLRVSGRNATDDPDIPLGAFHSIDVQMNQVVSVGKAGNWDSVSESMLEEALSMERAGDGGIAAVVLDDRAAHICLITPNRTLLKVKVSAEQSRKSDAPKKKAKAGPGSGPGSGAGTDTGTAPENPYYHKVITTLMRNFDFSRPRPLVLASPGFTAANVKSYLSGMTTSDHDTKFFKALGRGTVVVATPSGSLHGLNTAINGPEMRGVMADMRFTQEAQYLDRFMEVSRFNDGRAHYGVRPVTKAVEAGAVGPGKGLLLLNNSLFRSKEVAERKRFVALVDAVKAAGGEVRIISSEHESGKHLGMLGNIAAVLNFPMPELDDDDDEEEGDEAEAVRTRQQEEEARQRADERRREGEVDDLVMDSFGSGS